MENRKLIIIIPTFLWGLLFLGICSVSAYHTQTHEYLTQETVQVYNSNSSSPIDSSLLPYLIDGTRREDDTPRFLNHFYDPVYNRGLARDAAIDPAYYLGSYPSSLVWAQSSNQQKKIQYNPVIATVLSSIQRWKIQSFLPTSDFTWDAALRYWIQGDKEMAMFTLGHVLHLVQDLTVPAHTRNDPHGEGDPYEDWAEQYATSHSILPSTPVALSSLDNYFDSLATYTNNNFYSNDTIGIQSGYSNPQPTNEEIFSDFLVGVKNERGNIYKLYIKNKQSLLSGISSNSKDIKLISSKAGGDLVLRDYWSLLAPKATSYGAGIIDLFFKEAKARENDPSLAPKKSFLGQIIEGAKNIFSGLFGSSEQQIGEISNDPTSSPAPQNAPPQESNNTSPPSAQPQSDQPTPIPAPLPIPPSTPPQLTQNTFLVTRVIDGDTIELENGEVVRYIGINAPELSGDECYAQESKQYNEFLVLNKRVRLEAGGEQDTDQYGRLLRYVWVDDTLVNQALIEEGAGYAFNFHFPHQYKDTFERTQNQAESQKRGLWGDGCRPEPETVEEAVSKKGDPCPYVPSGAALRAPVIINEVAWMGTPASGSDEWIELKNNSHKAIDLSGWTLVDKSEQIQILFDSDTPTIPSEGFFLLERSDDDTLLGITADYIYTGALSNSKEGLRLFDSSCALVDEVLAQPDWPAGHSSQRRTMERSSTLDWHTSSVVGGTPRQHNSTPHVGGGGGGGGGGGANALSDSTNTSTTIYNVRLNEIMYDLEGSDEGGEWVEIYNADTSSVDITQLRFYEQDTHHTLTLHQGETLLVPAAFAVIADDPLIFLAEWPNYTGALFDGSFSFHNDGELIGISQNDALTNQLTYHKDMGGNGDGSSLSLINEAWTSGTPTPGEENIPYTPEHTTATSTPDTHTASAVNHLLISEIQVKGDASNDEFIELYNPIDNSISLEGYSLQYVSGQATSTATVSKKNFDAVRVAPHGFYLLTHTQSALFDEADMHYSFQLSGISSGASVALVATTTPIISLHDDEVVDVVSYGDIAHSHDFSVQVPTTGASIERKALIDEVCYSPIELHAFDGNGCDTDSADDFVIQPSPSPQSSTNLIEPRTPPLPPDSLQGTYNPSTVTIQLSWSTSPTSDVTYEMFRLKEDGEAEYLGETTDTTFSYQATQLNSSYTLGVRATDADGLGSPTTDVIIEIPSFINDLTIYPSSEDGLFVAKLRAPSYPFIPDIFSNGEGWKMMVAYLNHPAQSQAHIYDTWEPDTLEYIIGLKHSGCTGSDILDESVILPDTMDYCGIAGGAYNRSLDIRTIEDNTITFTIDPLSHPSFNSSSLEENYITLAFYSMESVMPSDGRVPYFGFVATDMKEYLFSSTPPASSPPSTPTNLTATAQHLTTSPVLLVSWDESTDPDSPDDQIIYELNIYHESEVFNDAAWNTVRKGFRVAGHNNGEPILEQTEPLIPLTQSGIHYLSLRATDPEGNVSSAATASTTVSLPITIINTGEVTPGNAYQDFDADGVHSPQRIAQNITLTADTYIEYLRIALETDTSGVEEYNAILSIHPAIQTPQGVALSDDISWQTTVTGLSRYTFGNVGYKTYSPNITLPAGEYFVVLESENTDPDSPQYLLGYTEDDVYPDGTFFVQYPDERGWMAKNTKDLNMIIRGTQ